MISKPVNVPVKEITSVDLPNFAGGQYLNGAQNAPVNSFIDSTNVELDKDGFIIGRRKLSHFLPDTISASYQKFPVLWNGVIYYFTIDNGEVVYAKEGDANWTGCTGENDVSSNQGGLPIFQRVLNNVMCLNGGNGDKLFYVDLSTAGFPVVKYNLIADPTSAPTATLTNLTTGSFNIYYAISYDGAVGETNLSPILTQSINIVRDQWGNVVATPGSIKLTRVGAAPAGAKFWNVYMAVAATAGTIQPSDLLQLAVKLDLATTTFVDDGTLSINLSSVSPTANSTDGPRVTQGTVEDGNPILWGDVDNPYNIWIGGGGPNAMDFSISNGGYLAQPEQGTNYYPTTVIGFRNGQGIPSLTVLFSNTEGLSKQSVLQQQTVNYGDQSFTVWGVTEQHYGAAGVSAPNSAINYLGKLLFLSTDGFMSMETQPTVQNVLSTQNVDSPIDDYVKLIKVEAMKYVVGAGWGGKFMWLVPNAGFDTPQQILVLDTNNKGVEGNGAWYTLDIPANWIGVVSSPTEAAFVYIVQGNSTYKLLDAITSYDTKGGVNIPFSMAATGPMVGMAGNAHNIWQADVQAMFYIMNLIGSITVGVNYMNQDGDLKTVTKEFDGPIFTPSAAGGWGDPHWTYANFPGSPALSQSAPIDESIVLVSPINKRIPVEIDDIFNEAQWFFNTPVGYNSLKVRAISYEGINLGVRPDLQ